MDQHLLDALKQRRSIRSFQDKPVDRETVEIMLDAAVYAPTGMGAQSPVIIVVQDEEAIQQLSEMNRSILGGEDDPYYGAKTIFVVVADKYQSTYVEDGSMVLSYLYLAAHAMGLGACWIHREKEMFETDEGLALLEKWGLDDDYAGVGALAVGYIQGEIPPPARRKPDYIRRQY